ncbi:MAG: hypothetical protein AB7V62_01300 [Thermoleophilia bacterium]
MTRSRALLLTALGCALAATPALAQDPEPREIPVAEDGTVCGPGSATVSTPRLTAEVSAVSGKCVTPDPDTGLPRATLHADGGLRPHAGTPRLVLRPGERVRFAFTGTPTAVVRLEARPGPSAQARTRTYRLSPFAPVWRARPGSGLLVVTATLPAPTLLERSGTQVATYFTTYRTVRA